MAKISSQEWQDFISGCPGAHILQTNAWGELKSSFGWTPTRLIQGNLGAQILVQQLPLGYKVAYIPRGPVSSSGSLINHPDWPAFPDGGLVLQDHLAIHWHCGLGDYYRGCRLPPA